MNKLAGICQKYSIIIVLLFSILLSSCSAAAQVQDGGVEAIRNGAALWGMKQVIVQAAGTFLLQKGDCYMFVWNLSDGWAFTVVKFNSQQSMMSLREVLNIEGNYVNPKTWQDFVKYLNDQGWTMVPKAAYPLALKTVVVTAGSWLQSLATTTMTTFLFTPATGFTIAPSIIQTAVPYDQE